MNVKQNLEVAKGKTPPKFSTFMSSDIVKRKISEMVGGKDGQRFITSLVAAVANNPNLSDCDHFSILSAAMQGEALKLSPSPQMGQYYLIPFKDNKNNRKVATFQVGYKGIVQLAIRSGQYKDIDVIEIRDGEFKGLDRRTGRPQVEFIEDTAKREELPIVGYFTFFEMLNGFTKSLYWSREKMEKHAIAYSQGYKAKKGYTHWERDFDAMAYKTMLKQLILKWGVMSIEMQQALETDGATIKEDGSFEYVDYDGETGEIIDATPEPAPAEKVVEPEPQPQQQPPQEEELNF